MSVHTETSSPTPIAGASRRRLLRGGLILLAGLVSALAWVIVVPIVGMHLDVVVGGQPQTVGVGACIFGSIVGGLMGWAALALLERFTRSPRRIWTIVALVALVLSLSSPITAATSTSTAVILVLLHLIVGAIIIPLLPPTRRSWPRFRGVSDTN